MGRKQQYLTDINEIMAQKEAEYRESVRGLSGMTRKNHVTTSKAHPMFYLQE